MSAPLVFPVGHYLGERHPEATHIVRVGRERHELTADEFGVWVLAHGSGEVGRGAWTTEDLLALAGPAALAGAAATVDRLAAAGTLVLVRPSDAVAFAETYRMDSLLVGLGNSAADPDHYAVGIPGVAPVALLDASAYELWQWGHLAPTLWQTCEVRAKVSMELGEPVRDTEVLADLLGDLRVLLVSSCAYLDVARRG
ncbi:hypothetical protein [Actinokineospora sp.]|uniref:hypothetical protein n=1 Tax=Actinokineospora sp. TaxID=1872133 RepID=UPI00403834EE